MKRSVDRAARSDLIQLRGYLAGAIEKFETDIDVLQSRCSWLEDRLARLWSPSSSEPPIMDHTSKSSTPVPTESLNRSASSSGKGGQGSAPERSDNQ